MDVRSIQSFPVFTGTVKHHSRGGSPEAPAGAAAEADRPGTGTVPTLSTEEKSFFESLFPDSRKDVRAYQAYSGKGNQQKSASTGSLVDRKG
jgi:hypothetical protein